MSERDLPLWRRLRRRAWYALAVAVASVAPGLPLGAGRRLGRTLAALGWRLRGAERRIAEANVAAALPELGPAARRSLLMAAVARLGENLHDALCAPALAPRPGFVAFEASGGGADLAGQLAALTAKGRGVLILTGHLGCWELLGTWLARAVPAAGCGPLAVVTGTVRNPAVDRLVQGRRRAAGLVVLPREGGPGPLVRHLAAGGVAAVLLDQDLGVPSLDVPFFGRRARTPIGFGRLVLQRGVPVLPMAIGRQGEGHVVRSLPPLCWDPDPAAARDPRRVAAVLARCNEALETLVRRNPAEWVWFHDRWNDRTRKDRT
ncbi:MAG TPA: lysophospholipid acyltransferase family protein [Candidatus Krumholzibacteria bacterium]|nr:lysophospholipid acyltransferase family protein [Candidatus Krumholzibacteria bacterium]